MKALRRLDLALLGTVWIACVLADWTTGTKVALNLAAVLVLCAKEFAVHAWLVRNRGRGQDRVRAAQPRLAAVTA